MSRLAALAAAVILVPAAARTEPERLRQARNNFEFGKYEEAIRLIDEASEKKQLAGGAELVEAFRIQGLSHFYLGRRAQARRSFVKLLSSDPDFQLDPLLVPPLAIDEFESVKAENEATLTELRMRSRAAREERRLEEEARRKLLEGDERKGREADPVRVVRFVERVERHSLLSTLLPFGVAQFEQGRNTTGAIFAGAQVVTIVGSILSYTVVQSKLEPSGQIKRDNLVVAQRWRVVNWISFGLAALTYAGGVTDAVLRFQEERSLPVVPRELVPPQTPAASPPAPGRAGASLFLAPTPGGGVAAGLVGAF